MRFREKIENFEKFKEDFNDTVEIEGLKFDVNILLARLKKYARNWIQNQEKFNNSNGQTNKQTSPKYGKAI